MKTMHSLPFESRPWVCDPSIQEFRIGTCKGQWNTGIGCYCIISIINDQPGNGHLDDVFQWFENSCKRDGYALKIFEFFNQPFYEHCIKKRGFQPIPGTKDLVKFP